MICATNFIFAGEKILKDIMNAGNAESVKGAGEVFSSGKGAVKGAYGKVKGAGSAVGKWVDNLGK